MTHLHTHTRTRTLRHTQGIFRTGTPFAAERGNGDPRTHRAYATNQGALSEEEAMQLAYARSLSGLPHTNPSQTLLNPPKPKS